MVELVADISKPQPLTAVLDDIKEGRRPVAGPVTFATGLDPLDRVLDGGVRSRDLVLVGGGPGVGKTIATLQWARAVAAGGRCAIFASYEHDETSLLARLLLLEAGELVGDRGLRPDAGLRTTARRLAVGEIPFAATVAGNGLLGEAADRLAEYADRLFIVSASASHTGLRALDQIVGDRIAGEAILFVDYLQKVAAPNGAVDDEQRVGHITEGLKELALRRGVPVVAVVAGDLPGLSARRLRTHHLRGSAALAYEADVIVILNDKYRAVSNVHTAYDPVRAESFRRQVVFTVEKNRDGEAPLDLEFTKDFTYYRFEPRGGYVGERLVDDHFYTS